MATPYIGCPPLHQWRLPSGPEEAVRLGRAPRRLPRALRALPALSSATERARLVLVCGPASDAEVAAALAALVPGGWFVELRPVGSGVLGALLALDEGALAQARVGYEAVVAAVGRGLCDVQQWLSPDPPDTLVTCGRRRG